MSNSLITAVLVIHTILIVVLSILLLVAIRQIGVLSLRVGPVGSRTVDAGPAIGSSVTYPAELFASQELSPESHAHDVLFAFLSPGCPSCITLLPALTTAAREWRESLRVCIVLKTEDGAHLSALRQQCGKHVRLAESTKLFQEWNIGATPYCVMVRRDSTVAGKGITNTLEHVESLLNTVSLSLPTMDHWLAEQFRKAEPEEIIPKVEI